MLRRALSWILVAGIALAGVPLIAQDYSPNTVWGDVPSGAASAANAVLLDASGNVVATVPVVGGKFVFENVQPGQYTVALNDAASAALARSQAAQVAAGGVVKAIFDESVAGAAVLPPSTGGGFGTTAWVLTGIGAAGIGTIIYFATNDDDGVASESR